MAFTAKAVANFFLRAARDEGDKTLTPMKLQKLVYYAHGWHLSLTSGKPLINCEIEAWPYGPVIPSLYHEFKHFGNGTITAPATTVKWTKNEDGKTVIKTVTPIVPTDNEEIQSLLKKVWDVYKKYTPIQLSNMTHKEGSPWDIINKRYDGKIPKNTSIDDDVVMNYFDKLIKKEVSK